MAAERRLVNQISETYPHRQSFEGDMDAEKMLLNYLEQYDASTLEMDIDNGYETVLAWTEDAYGEFVVRTNFSYPAENGIETDVVADQGWRTDTVEAINHFMPETKVIDSASRKIDFDNPKAVDFLLSDRTLDLSSAHCVNFVDYPKTRIPDKDQFDSHVHQKSAEDAVSEPSIGTGIILVGEVHGEHAAAVNIDYWTRTYDGLADDGIDFNDWDWYNPE